MLCLVASVMSNLCDSMDCSLSGSSVHGILQARILEWVAISPSRGIFLTYGLNPRLLSLYWDFPGGPVVKTLHSQCRGPNFDSWSGN